MRSIAGIIVTAGLFLSTASAKDEAPRSRAVTTQPPARMRAQQAEPASGVRASTAAGTNQSRSGAAAKTVADDSKRRHEEAKKTIDNMKN